MPDAGERFDCCPPETPEEAHMLQSSNALEAVEANAMANVRPSVMPSAMPRAIVENVAKIAGALGCAGVWARTTGPYILLGLRGGDAFARLTALGGASYGLAFRAAPDDKRAQPAAWEPVLLIDELTAAIEHALIGIGASSAA
jgi:hypothetical protein